MKNFKISIAAVLLLISGAARASEPAFGSTTLSFEENRGQAPGDARFLARGPGYGLVLTREGSRLLLRHSGRNLSLVTRLAGANLNPGIRGEWKQTGMVNDFRRGHSVTDIPTYARVHYESVYPGIDLVYYGNQSQLEYDFTVKPGANPRWITLKFAGTDTLTVDNRGNLVLRAGVSEIVQHKPVVYQEIGRVRREIEGRYRILDVDTVGFDVGLYDPKAILIIDPVLTYSTFLGGSNGDDDGRAIAIDAAGNVYITGATTSTNFQTVSPLQPNAGDQDPGDEVSDAFVTKLNAAGTALVYSTYLGGTDDDSANAIAVDSSGNVTIAGSTASTNFPTTSGAIRRTCNSAANGTCLDAFVAKLNAAGSALLFSTYLGGAGDDEARGVAVDGSGNVYVTGKAASTNFPVTAGAFSIDSSSGGFVTKLSPTGAIVYSTYFGAGSGTTESKAIAVDSAGNAYVTGSTPSSTTTGTDVFITKLNAAGTAAVYSQFIRGAKDDTGSGVAVDSAGNAYVTGQTSSINFTTTPGVVQSIFGGGPAFRSSDAGVNWSASGNGINRSSLYALAIAPTVPATLYAGADDDTAGGIFKSTDGGLNWTAAGTGLADTRVHALAADPVSPATVYAGTRSSGVFKSTDGGASWGPTSLGGVFVTAIAINPSTPGTVYAATDGGVYKSANGGASWTTVNNGLASTNVRTLAIDPLTPATLYAGTGAGIYKTTDAGASWTSASSGLFDPNINALVLDPRSPNLLFAATNSVGIFRSTNGGAFWFASNGGLVSSSLGILASALAIDPGTGTLYAAIGESNVSRVYKSSNGILWTPANLSTAHITSLSVDRANSNAVYAATVGGSDAFVAKWNASGTLVYSTYFGGYGDDTGNAIAVDSSGNAYIAGNTSSVNFPTLSPFQVTFGGGSDVVTDAFVTKLNTSAAAITYSSYLGGSNNDFGKGIAVDPNGSIYVVGLTGSGDFPTALPVTTSRPGLLDAFIAKISDTNTISYSISPRGGLSGATQGGSTSVSAGYARIQPGSGSTTPSGIAIFSYRQDGKLLSEAAVPASSLINSGRVYAEVTATVNTGLAIVNPNSQDVTLNFYFTNESGINSANGTATIAANSQVAKFLTEAPFNSGPSASGTFTFTASAPVAVIALRGFTNERSEFLMTTLPVADLSAVAGTDVLVFPHFADGGGWTTQIVMVNSTDVTMAGSIQFSEAVTVEGQTGITFPYEIPGRSSRRLRTAGTGTVVQAGSVRMTPNANNRTPTGLAIFAYRNNGVTVTEAGVPALRTAAAFRLYAESSGFFNVGQIGSAQTGIAIANASAAAVTVNFELSTLSGASTGLTGVETLPADGHMAKFLSQIAGFTNLQSPFQGVLRVSTASPAGISVVGLRGRYNERNDFLITTTQPTDESRPASTNEQFFPHMADGGGYTTQFVLFNGSTDQASSGSLRFFSQSGQSLSLSIR